MTLYIASNAVAQSKDSNRKVFLADDRYSLYNV